MNCQILFSEKNKKKNISNLSSAEFAQSMVSIKVNGYTGRFSFFFDKEDNFRDFCLPSCTPVLFGKGVYSKRSKCVPFRVDPFLEGSKTVLIELSPLKV